MRVCLFRHESFSRLTSVLSTQTICREPTRRVLNIGITYVGAESSLVLIYPSFRVQYGPPDTID